MNKDYFPEVIGQEDVKRKLGFYIDGYQKTSMIPHFLFVAEKGCGKTMFAGKVAKNLILDGEPKKAKEILCRTLKTKKQFTDQILIPLIQDNDVTLVFDEAGELSNDVTFMLLTMLNPTDSNSNTITTPEGDDIVIDFKRHSFMFATTDPQKVNPALKNRCNRIDFEPYKSDELMKMVKNSVEKQSKITFDGLVTKEIPTVLRNNPRCAQLMAQDIVNYCSQFGVQLFDMVSWEEMKKCLNIKPLGLNATELQCLRAIKKSPHCRLTDLSAKLGLTASAIQRDVELFLLRNNLIKVDSGRVLTVDGEKYLENL